MIACAKYKLRVEYSIQAHTKTQTHTCWSQTHVHCISCISKQHPGTYLHCTGLYFRAVSPRSLICCRFNSLLLLLFAQTEPLHTQCFPIALINSGWYTFSQNKFDHHNYKCSSFIESSWTTYENCNIEVVRISTDERLMSMLYMWANTVVTFPLHFLPCLWLLMLNTPPAEMNWTPFGNAS